MLSCCGAGCDGVFAQGYELYRIRSGGAVREHLATLNASAQFAERGRPAFSHQALAITPSFLVLIEGPCLMPPRSTPFSYGAAGRGWLGEGGRVIFRVLEKQTGVELGSYSSATAWWTWHHVNSWENSTHVSLDLSWVPDGQSIGLGMEGQLLPFDWEGKLVRVSFPKPRWRGGDGDAGDAGAAGAAASAVAGQQISLRELEVGEATAAMAAVCSYAVTQLLMRALQQCCAWVVHGVVSETMWRCCCCPIPTARCLPPPPPTTAGFTTLDLSRVRRSEPLSHVRQLRRTPALHVVPCHQPVHTLGAVPTHGGQARHAQQHHPLLVAPPLCPGVTDHGARKPPLLPLPLLPGWHA